MSQVPKKGMRGTRAAYQKDGWTLALALCGPQLEVALAGPERGRVSSLRLAGTAPRSSLLLAAIGLLVEEAGIEPPSIDRVVVSRGPGSFTGIRSGLATAFGLEVAGGARVLAFNSLLMQAARAEDVGGRYMTAQPGRRGEVYTQCFEIGPEAWPRPLGAIEISRIDELSPDFPWIAPQALFLGDVPRAVVANSGAEALIRLSFSDLKPEAPEALYVEGPPIHGGARA